MKVIQINSVCGRGSTGKICVSVSNLLNENGVQNYNVYSTRTSDCPNGIKLSSDIYIKLQALFSRLFGNYGFNSFFATKKLIRFLDLEKPDIIHIHNIHSHNCNIGKLFEYIKKNNIKVFYTFHDCWTFTAYCPYFDLVKCDKWRKKCCNCPQYKRYSWFFDRSSFLFERKRKMFQGLNLTIITPSRWLANLVNQSFLRDYPVKVINNGIDLSVFKPTESNFRKRYELNGKKIVLGVAAGWDRRKGLDVFVDLVHRLSDDYVVILVGTDKKIDLMLPKKIISIHRTNNQKELAEIYSVADVFVNPTREENYPTVNMEAIACGTPVVTFRTGGSPEIVDETCGSVVNCDDIDSLYNEIVRICEQKPYSTEACLARSRNFDRNERFDEYVKLYRI